MSAIASITVNRVAVTMPSQEKEGETHDGAHVLVAEIAERLEELNDIRCGFAGDLVQHLACIATNSRRAFDLTVALLHCNYDDVLASYQEQAERRGVTKQDVHWEFMHEVAKLERLYPVLHKVIMATRAQALAHEDPIARSETVGRAGNVGCDS